MSNLVFCIMGPTASGKTALACELLSHAPFELISVDSAMIYRGMNIGTAKPSPQELEKAPHHLIDIIDPIESYSAAQFCTQASELCDSILKKGAIPVLVGGTMMYFNALQKGLSVLPEADESLRQQLDEEALAHGLSALHKKLECVDPKAAARIHPHDAQRIQRALEVFYTTGMPLSDLLAQKSDQSKYHFINIALFPQNRAWLHERIAKRFAEMLAGGFVDEVQGLITQWDLHQNMPSMRCVGYRQVLGYLGGEYDASMMQEKGIAATRQLAKRQLTWLRSWDDALFYDPQKPNFIEEIIAKIGEILDNESSLF